MAELPLAEPSEVIQNLLRPGERLVWCGRPDPAVLFAPADVFLVPFSIMWGGFALFWEASVIASGGPPFFMAWGVPFVAMALYFICGRFVLKRRQKLRTVYGVTTDRALVVVGGSRIEDTPLVGVPTSIRRRGGHASVTFGPATPWFTGGMYANTGMDFFMRGSGGVAFYDVSHGDELLAALDRVRSKA